MKYHIHNAYEWLYPDTPCSENQPAAYIKLICAKNSSCAFQLLLKPSGTEKEIVAALTPSNQDGVSAELFTMLPVFVEKNTGTLGYTATPGEDLPYITRPAPFWVYDCLKPEPTNTFYVDKDKVGIYIRFDISINCNKGKKEYSLILRSNKNVIKINIELYIYNVCIPKNNSLEISNWYNIANIANRHNLEIWSEPFWSMFYEYALLMKRCRQTHFLLPFLSVDVTKEDDQWIFSFQKAERLIKMFFDLGFTTIEGGPLARQLYLGDNNFVLLNNSDIKAASKEGITFQKQYYQAFYQFLKERNWHSRLVQHIADEPFDNSINEYELLSEMARKQLPDIPIIEAICTSKIKDYPDIPIPDNRRFEENMNDFCKIQEKRPVWFYTCALPGGGYCNRLLDLPLLKTRMLHWGNAKYGLKGYLHWGFNGYREGQNPIMETSPRFSAVWEEKYLPPGDTHIVYPGKGVPYPSIRLEQMKGGIEDYELLKLLLEKDRKQAYSIISQCFTSFLQVGSTREFLVAYETLLTKAEDLQ